jgi:TolA-binding protein
MTNPQRFLEGDGTELERQLLAAGRAERPALGGKRHAARALAVATSAGFFSKVAWASTRFLKIGLGTGGKLAAGALVSGSVAVAGWQALPTEPAPLSSVASTVRTATKSVNVPAPEVAPEAEQPSVAAEDLTLEPSSPEPDKSRSADPIDNIAAQLKLLDSARSALKAGSPGRAIALLDQYARTYPRGKLTQEATLLRVEALVRSGKQAQAVSLARRFRTAHPSSPYTQRLESIVGEF